MLLKMSLCINLLTNINIKFANKMKNDLCKKYEISISIEKINEVSILLLFLNYDY